MDQKSFDKRVKRHAAWLRSKRGGRQLQVRGEDLQHVKALDADLCVSKFDHAAMRGADLSEARMCYGEVDFSDFSEAVLDCANLSYGLIRDTSFAGASLRGAFFNSSRLVNVDFAGADLSNAMFEHSAFHNVCLRDTILSWNSRDLLAEVLWQAAKSVDQEMLAALVQRKYSWCWDSWIKLDHPCKEWAIKTLAARVQKGNDAPRSIRLVALGTPVEDALAEWESFS